jgi:hypothetical protein
MVDDELRWLQRVDLLRVAAHGSHGITHGGQIYDRGHPGEILEQNPGRHEGDLDRRLRLWVPPGNRLDVFRGNRFPVLSPQEILEQDAHAEGQSSQRPALLFECHE